MEFFAAYMKLGRGVSFRKMNLSHKFLISLLALSLRRKVSLPGISPGIKVIDMFVPSF